MKIITIDMDGTMYDSWACCGRRDGFSGSETCRHMRTDTWDRIGALLSEHAAKLVVLSWRSGLVSVTDQWLQDVGIRQHIGALYIPGSEDTDKLTFTPLPKKLRNVPSQVAFKVRVVRALQKQGHEIVGSFDDNVEVLDALAKVGCPTYLAERRVIVSKEEWTAGRLFTSAA